MTNTELKTTLLLACIYMTRMLGLFLIFPTFSLLAQNLDNATPEKIGLALGVYSLAQAVLQIPMGWLSDIIGRKKVLYAGLVLFLLGSVLAASTRDVDTLIIARLLQGMGAVSAVCLAYVGDSIRGSEQGKAMMVIGMAIGGAFMLAFMIGAPVSTYWGLSGLFALTALLAILAIVFTVLLPDAPQPLASVDLSAFKQTLFNRGQLGVNVQVLLLHMTLSASFFLLPLLLTATVSYLFAYVLPLLLTAIIVAPLVRHRDTGIARLPYCWLILLAALICLASFSLSTSVASLLIIMTLFFSGFTLIETLLPAQLLSYAGEQSRGASSGIFSVFQFGGNFLGGLLGAKCYTIFEANDTIQYSFFILAIPALVISASIFFKQFKNKG